MEVTTKTSIQALFPEPGKNTLTFLVFIELVFLTCNGGSNNLTNSIFTKGKRNLNKVDK